MAAQSTNFSALVYGGTACVIAPVVYYGIRLFLTFKLLSGARSGSVTLEDPLSVFKWVLLAVGVVMILIAVTRQPART